MKGKPSRAYYGLVAIPLLLAGVGFFWLLITGIRSLTSGLTRVIMPGTMRIHLQHTGPQMVYYEYESRVEDRVFQTSADLREMTCKLTASAGGAEIPLRKPWGSTTYTYTGHYSGYSVLRFMSKEPGDYDFACQYSNSAVRDEVVLAIGPDNASDEIFKMVFEGMFIGFAGLGLSALIIVWIFRKRNIVGAWRGTH